MDTSETYIKMCKKAKKIQAIWQKVPQGLWHGHYSDGYDGSFYYIKPQDNTDDGIRCVDYEHDTSDIAEQTWLPRQDQLQEMYSGDLYTLLHDFTWFIEQGDKSSMQCTSMEQLWLAFVMKEKYGKVWDGEEWR